MAFFQVLVSPTAAFERLRERGGWIVALLLVSALSVATTYLQWPLIEKEMLAQFEAQQQPLGAAEMDMVLQISRVTAWVTGAVMPAALMFFVGLLLFLLNMIVRGEGTYMQLSKVSLYSMIPGLLGGLLTTALAMAFDADSITDVMLNGGVLFSEKTGFLFTLVSSVLDPFGLWSLVLTVVGAAVMMRKSPKSVAFWIVGAWLLVRLGTSLFALIPAAPAA
ncbi:YIP1 family protein [Paenibacillus antri]|nr:YIP1 family protein [Paenibacillus antri]